MLDPLFNTPAKLPANHPPVLIVIVDTEEEFDWTQPFSRHNVGTQTIQAQPLIHDKLFDRYGIVPTYCIDWPVATTPSSIATLKTLQDSGRCEIGTHLHPWVSPPHTEEVSYFNSYTGNLPAELEYQKLKNLTEAITQHFGKAPTTFKAGRYGLGENTAQSLAKLGYTIDASIVPKTSFASEGGPDFLRFNEHPFWFKANTQTLLELPVTTAYCGKFRGMGDTLHPLLNTSLSKKFRLGGIAARLNLLEKIRLTPEGCSASELIKLVRTLHQDGCEVFSLTYHSPSLSPGHTPYVKSAAELAAFLNTIDQLCEYFASELNGVFMSVSSLHSTLTHAQSKQPS